VLMHTINYYLSARKHFALDFKNQSQCYLKKISLD
jgi:hypothetical protein